MVWFVIIWNDWNKMAKLYEQILGNSPTFTNYTMQLACYNHKAVWWDYGSRMKWKNPKERPAVSCPLPSETSLRVLYV